MLCGLMNLHRDRNVETDAQDFDFGNIYKTSTVISLQYSFIILKIIDES